MGIFEQRQNDQLLKQYIEMLSKFPLFQYMKAPAGSISELWRRYPAGGEYGWYALVYDLKTIVYWDPINKTWQPISSAPTTNNSETNSNVIFVDTIDQLPLGACGFNSDQGFKVDGKIYSEGTAYTAYYTEEKIPKSQLLVLSGGIIAIRYCNAAGVWTVPDVLARKSELMELIQSSGSVISSLTGTQYSTFNNQLIEF